MSTGNQYPNARLLSPQSAALEQSIHSLEQFNETLQKQTRAFMNRQLIWEAYRRAAPAMSALLCADAARSLHLEADDYSFLLNADERTWKVLDELATIGYGDFERWHVIGLIKMIRRDASEFAKIMTAWGWRGINFRHVVHFFLDMRTVYRRAAHESTFGDFVSHIEDRQRSAIRDIPAVVPVAVDDLPQLTLPDLAVTSLDQQSFEQELCGVNLGFIVFACDRKVCSHDYLHVLRVGLPGEPYARAYQILSPFFKHLDTIKLTDDWETDRILSRLHGKRTRMRCEKKPLEELDL